MTGESPAIGRKSKAIGIRPAPARLAERAIPVAAHLAYRPEIDGLRAIAVLGVILFHAGLSSLEGGFVGVDVFFVLSGFLIGRLLWVEIQTKGRISLGSFWMRRLRRLAPAYLVMTICIAAVGYLILLPFELREMGKESIAATVWLSNVYFWQRAGYFDGAAAEKPMLHTWSLSVEEQFYLVLPLLLLGLVSLQSGRREVIGVLVLAWGASFAAMVGLSSSRPEAAFYLFPLRAWELLTGVLLAISGLALQQKPRKIAGWAGLALILAGLLGIRAEGFPGWQAAIPVAGTALALLAIGGKGPEGSGWLLAQRGPVFVGKISYALYLWHWPVLVLATYWRGEMGMAERAAWLALAVLLATLSWRYVESPLRRPPSAGGVPSSVLLMGVVAGGALVLALGVIFYRTDGLPSRFPAELRAHIDASGDFIQDSTRCATRTQGPFADLETCAIGPEAPPRVLFWGDSHLRALMDGLAEAAASAGSPGLILWRAGCPPLLNVMKQESAATPAQDAECPATTAQVMAAIEASDSLEAVVLVGRWTYYAEGAGVGRDAHNTISLSPKPGSGLAGSSGAELYADALEATVQALREHGLRVAVLRQVPEIPDYGARDVARGLAHGRLTPASLQHMLVAPPEMLAARVQAAESPIWHLGEVGTIEVIDPWPLLCSDACGAMNGGQALYFDNNHLTNTGARHLAPLFVSFLRDHSE